jgi:hypothetical protein
MQYSQVAYTRTSMVYIQYTEVEFLDVIGTKVLRVFLFAFDSYLYLRFLLPTPPEQKWFETGW